MRHWSPAKATTGLRRIIASRSAGTTLRIMKALSPGFPHHKHVGNQTDRRPSDEVTPLEEVIQVINPQLNLMQSLAMNNYDKEERIPYQPLMGSILHKYVSGRLVEKIDARDIILGA